MLSVSEAVKRRMSVRAFRGDPVPEDLLREILDLARLAPSGGNVQPWRVIAVTGAERDKVMALAQANAAHGADESGERPVYPPHLWEPYRSRRFAVGEQMYALLGIPREDRAARLERFARNLAFFDAPVGLFFVTERGFGHCQWAHMGMLMQTIALLAVERGLSTCMQEAWSRLRETLAQHFALPASQMIYCGMALGYADAAHPVNQLRSERASLDEIATFRGF